MSTKRAVQAPPFCPNPQCPYHREATVWRWIRAGFHARQSPPYRVQRYQCCHCRRHFSAQTFRLTYWLKRPGLLAPIFHGLVAGSAFRQLARSLAASPQTIALHSARLGRHAQLIRHSGANPKRETIAFSKRRQSAAERLWVLLVWRNCMKWFSERRRSDTPAMRAGVTARRLRLKDVLAERLFITRLTLPERWEQYDWRQVPTRRIAHCRKHRLSYAA